MNGQFRVVDGKPGGGKGLEFVRLMMQSARRKRNIATNFAFKPEFAEYYYKHNPSGILCKLSADEVFNFYRVVAKGFDIYIDEGAIGLSSIRWAEIRTKDFDAYYAMFRKDFDDITVACQEFERLVNLLRDKAEVCIRCRCLRIPKSWPFWSDKPVFFWVKRYKVDDITRKLAKKGSFPNFYSARASSLLYPFFDTTARADEGGAGAVVRPTIQEMIEGKVSMEIVKPAGGLRSVSAAASDAAPVAVAAAAAPSPVFALSAPAAAPVDPPAAPKRSKLRKWLILGGVVMVAGYFFGRGDKSTGVAGPVASPVVASDAIPMASIDVPVSPAAVVVSGRVGESVIINGEVLSVGEKTAAGVEVRALHDDRVLLMSPAGVRRWFRVRASGSPTFGASASQGASNRGSGSGVASQPAPGFKK